jgi:hypothetical protein
MTPVRSRETHGRNAVFLLVLLSHCALILFISRSSTLQTPTTQMLEAPLLVFFLDSTKARTASDAAKEASLAKPQTALKRRNAQPPSIPPGPAAADATPSNAITDWYGEVHSIAQDMLEKDQVNNARRGFEHKMPTAQTRESPTIFDPFPVPRAGTWDGPDRYYVTDNCYYDYDRAPRPPPTLLDNRLKTPVCKAPPRGGGDAMFKDLTPDYLKTSPAPKAP